MTCSRGVPERSAAAAWPAIALNSPAVCAAVVGNTRLLVEGLQLRFGGRTGGHLHRDLLGHRRHQRIARGLVGLGKVEFQSALHQQLFTHHLVEHLETVGPGRFVKFQSGFAFQLGDEVTAQDGALVDQRHVFGGQGMRRGASGREQSVARDAEPHDCADRAQHHRAHRVHLCVIFHALQPLDTC